MFPQEYNQKNKDGQKIGEWIEYNPEGYKKRIKHYIPIPFEVKPDTFLIPDATLESYDTIIAPNPDLVKTRYGYVSRASLNEDGLSDIDWIIEFEYDSGWQLKRAIKTDFTTSISIFLYGNQQEIGVSNHNYQLESTLGNNYQLTILIENFSDKSVSLKFENLPENINANTDYLVPANSEYELTLDVNPELNNKEYYINVVGENIKIELIVKTEAYHFKTTDFQVDTPIIITDRDIVIKRTNSEALLTIKGADNKKNILQIPLTFELSQINLAELTPRDYIFEFTDFSNDSKITKKIVLK